MSEENKENKEVKTFTRFVKLNIRAYNDADADEQLEDMMDEIWADSWDKINPSDRREYQ